MFTLDASQQSLFHVLNSQASLPTRRHLMKFLRWILPLLVIYRTMLASDWPQWRGPNRDGVWTETGIRSSFPATGLVPNWKAAVGFGYSSPIIASGRLYLSDLVVEKTYVHERVSCFDARSGKRVWQTQHETFPPDWFFNPEQMRGPGATPVIHNGRVYAISMFMTLECFDARTGAVIMEA